MSGVLCCLWPGLEACSKWQIGRVGLRSLLVAFACNTVRI